MWRFYKLQKTFFSYTVIRILPSTGKTEAQLMVNGLLVTNDPIGSLNYFCNTTWGHLPVCLNDCAERGVKNSCFK